MEKIGRFEIVGKLGRGAFGMVYKGRDPIINRLAAIKVMSEATVGDPELVQRFKREAEAAGGLNHRNIVTIYDLGEHNGLPYIAMEFLEGNDIGQVLKKRTEVPTEKKVDWMIQVADGLYYAHQKNIVHRDIKPDNIRLLDDGTIKIMDFGIAKMASSDMTRTGQFMGTVNYMSPEQIKAKKIDGRSDLFAVGIMFYELLSFRRPFPGDSITAVIYKIVNENPAALTELHGTPFEWLEGAVFKCLEKDVDKRWADCQDFANALRSRQQVAVSVGPSATEQTLITARQKATEGDIDAAMATVDSILANDPTNESVIHTRRAIQAQKFIKESDSLMSSGRLEQARDRLLEGKEELEDAPEIDEALKSLEEEIRATKAENLYEAAMGKLKDERFEEAIALLDDAAGVDPYNDQVKQALNRAKESKRKADVGDLLSEAKGNIDAHRLAEAREAVRRALEVDPRSREAKAMMQTVERELQVMSTRSAVDEVLFAAKTALGKKQFDDALKGAEGALALEPRNDEAKQIRDQALKGKLEDERRVAVQESLAAGRAALSKKKFGAARQRFQKALELDPDAEEAKLGLLAAQRKKTSIESAEQRVPVAAVAVVVLLIAAAAAGWFFTRPSEVAKAIALGDLAGDPGRRFELYLGALDLDGKPAEKEQARSKIGGLVPEFEKAGDLMRVKEIFDHQVKWSGSMDSGLRSRYVALAESLSRQGVSEGKSASVRGAFETYQSVLGGAYDKSRDYEVMGDVYSLGEKATTAARNLDFEPKRRLELYAVAQEVLGYVDSKDVSFGAFFPASEARAERVQLDELVSGVETFQAEANKALAKAQLADSKGDYTTAIGGYKSVQRLIAQNRSLASLIDLDRYQTRTDTALTTLTERMQSEAASATAEVLLARASAFADAGDLTTALQQYMDVLKNDAGNAVAKQRAREINNSLNRVAALKVEIQSAIDAGNNDTARSKLAQATALNSADTDLAGLESELNARVTAAAEALRVAGFMSEADALFGAGKLDEAEAKYREIITSTRDKALRQEANGGLNKIRLKKVEAQIAPLVTAANELEAKGDAVGAMRKWNEVKRLNNSYPGLDAKLSGLSRLMNKAKIDILEAELSAAYKTIEQDPRPYQRVSLQLLDLDADNQLLKKLEAEIKAKADGAAAARQREEAARAAAAAAAAEAARADSKTKQALDSASAALRRNDPDAALRSLQGLDPKNAAVVPIAQSAREQQQQREQGNAALRASRAAVDAGKKQDAVAQANRAKELWPPLRQDADRLLTAAEDIIEGGSVAPGAPSLRDLVRGGQWGQAAAIVSQSIAQGDKVNPKLAGRVFFNASHSAACADPCDLPTAKKWAEEAAKYENPKDKVSNSRWVKTLEGFSKCDMQLRTVCTQINTK